MEKLNEHFWNERYLNSDTGWDMKQVSPPLKYFIDSISNKDASILIPGCGNAYEASYLLSEKFTNVTLVDISDVLVRQLRNRFKGENIKIFNEDFFAHDGKYDWILEQTFYCALPPGLRKDYVEHAHEILNENGKVAGVLFNDRFGFDDHPPFKVDIPEFKKMISPYFDIIKLEPCNISIMPRMGHEILFELIKKERK